MVWALRIVWITLPLTAGAAASSMMNDWTDATQFVAAALLWIAWAVGLLAAVAPRPVSLTALRIVAPAFVVVAIVATIDGAPSTLASLGALAATVAALALASGHDIALVAANATAYGDEQRVLLRTPPALFLAPVPAARLAVGLAIAAPPLLLADEKWTLGIVSLLLAVPLVLVLTRALHGLSRRWGVVVPAGFVLLDPLTLSDPVLFLREKIASMGAADAAAAPDGVLDLRLGAAAGSVALVFTEPAELQRSGRGRRGGATVTAREVRFAVVRRDELLALAARRIRVN